jgi:hypothetical protein
MRWAVPTPRLGMKRMAALRGDRFTRYLGRSRLSAACVIASLMLVLVALRTGYKDVNHFNGIDLRRKVIGARALLAGFDPYVYRLITNDAGRPLSPPLEMRAWNELPYTPPVLLVYAVFANLDYPVQRVIWWGIEWGALLGSIALLMWVMRGARERVVFSCLAMVFFAAGYFFRLHVERGQHYSLFLLLLSVGCTACVRGGRGSWWGGIAFGVAGMLRPTLLMLPLPLWIAGYRRAAIATAGSALGVFVATLPLTGIEYWQSYARVIDAYEKELLSPGYIAKNLGVDPMAARDRIEGTAGRERAMDARSMNTVVMSAPFYFASKVLPMPDILQWGRLSRVLLVVMVLGACALLLWANDRPLPRREAMAYVAVMAVAADFFVPMRWGYVDVMFLLPLGLEMRQLLSRSFPRWPLVIVIASLLLGHEQISEALPVYVTALTRSYGLMVGLGGSAICLALLHMRKGRWPRSG